MKDEFSWSVEEFLGTPPLEMILEGLGNLSATHLEVRDPSGGTAGLGLRRGDDDSPVLSPIQIHGRDVGMVVGYSHGAEDRRVPMTVALAASLISQFLRSTREVRDLTVEIDRRSRGLSLLDRLDRDGADGDERGVADWFLGETLSLVGASRGVLFARNLDGRLEALACSGMSRKPLAGALSRRIAEQVETLDLRSLGRLPTDLDPHGVQGSCEIETFLTTPALGLPIRFGDRCLGVLWVCGGDGRTDGFAEDRDLLRGVAAQFGLWMWGGRAVDMLRHEERARGGIDDAERLRSAYLPEPSVGRLGVEVGPGGMFGTVALSGTDEVFWISSSEKEDPVLAAAGAAVVRGILEALAPRCVDPAELVERADEILARLEAGGAPRHGLTVVRRCDHGLEGAFRGLPGPITCPCAEDPPTKIEAGEGTTPFVLDCCGGLIGPDGSFRIREEG